MKKKTKKPKDELIKSVLEDLQNETADPSIHGQTDSHAGPQGLFDQAHLEKTTVLGASTPGSENKDDKTAMIGEEAEVPAPVSEDSSIIQDIDDISEKTFVAAGRPRANDVRQPKAAFGSQKPSLKSSAFEAQFLQAENLKIAQQRIIELEKDVERLRKENEILSSAGEMAKHKTDDLMVKVQSLDRQRFELKETNESELRIFKEGLHSKDSEIGRLKQKVEELESRLANDLRKIRVRERELENRLELAKMEKTALLRSKDETILDLKRRTDNLNSEIENFQNKIIELNQRLEGNQEQFSRTVRALRIALTNLEVSENTSSITLAPYKKAE